MARGIDLVVERQLGALRQRGVQDGRIRLGQQQPGGVALRIADDLAARRVGRGLGVAHRAQRGAVEQGAVVQVQQEHRRVGRDGIDFFDRGQALFGELVLGETAHHPHPLRRRRDGDLALEHRHGVGQRAHAVPAQFHVVVQAAAHHMGVVVEQAGQGAALLEVDAPGAGPGQRHDLGVGADGDEAAVLDGHGAGQRLGAVQRGDAAVVEDDIGSGVRGI